MALTTVAVAVALLPSLAMDLISFEGEKELMSVAPLKVVCCNGRTRSSFVIFQSI